MYGFRFSYYLPNDKNGEAKNMYSQVLYKSEPDRVTGLREEVGTHSYPQPRNYLRLITTENTPPLFFPNEVSPGIQRYTSLLWLGRSHAHG